MPKRMPTEGPFDLPATLRAGLNVPVEKRRRFVLELRRAAWEIRDTGAFEELLGRLRDGLDWLEIPFFSCGLNLVDTSADPLVVWLYALDRPGQWSRMQGAGHDMVFRFWRGQETVYRPDIRRDDPYNDAQWVDEMGYDVRSIVDIPFSHGTLAINSEVPEAFDAEDMALFAEIGQALSEGFGQLEGTAGLSGLTARLSRIQRQLEEKTLLLDAYGRLGRDILSSLSLDDILGRLAEGLLEAAIFRAVAVALVEDGSAAVHAVAFMDGKGRIDLHHGGPTVSLKDEGPLARAAASGSMQAAGEEGWLRCTASKPPLNSGLSRFVPVTRGDEVLAVVGVYSPDRGEEEVRQRVELMQPLLDQLAIAIDHSRLYEERRQQNEELERRVAERTAQLQRLNRDLEAEVERRRSTEETLRASEESFRQLAENIREVFWLTDVNRDRLLYVSPAFEDVWGVPADDLYAEEGLWLEAIHPEDREAALESVRAQRAGSETDLTYRLRRADGTERMIRDRGFPIRDEGGAVYRIVGLAEDVTEQRRWEEALHQGQKMQALGQLTAGVSHNFNNLLTAVSVGLEMADESGPVGQRALQNARSATDKAIAMIKQLMDFARAESHSAGQPVDMAVVTAECVELVRKTFDRRVVLEIDVKPGLPLVKGDAGRLEQVLLNLLINARDAVGDTRAPRIEVEIALCDSAEAEAGQIRLQVRDNGPGIDAETQRRLFEPFFTTKPVGEGTGLGLATAYGIVKEHGGTIECRSEPGAGACFSVLLPAVSSDAETGPVLPPEGVAETGTGETLLVVDDEPLVREGLRSMLQRRGYRVLAAADGRQAWDLLVERDFAVDLMILDLSMPELSGEEILERLRQVSPGLKVLLSTGYAPSSVQTLEVQGFLPKPYSMDDAFEAVRRVLDA